MNGEETARLRKKQGVNDVAELVGGEDAACPGAIAARVAAPRFFRKSRRSLGSTGKQPANKVSMVKQIRNDKEQCIGMYR